MATIGERLTELLKSLKIKQLHFSRRTGIEQSYLSALMRDKETISRAAIEKITDAYPLVSETWLLRGVGSMFLEGVASSGLLQESGADYVATPAVKSYQFATENIYIGNISANLRAAAKRWGMFDYELMGIVAPDVPRSSVVRHMGGRASPSLTTLLRFEAVSGIPIWVLLSKQLAPDDFPMVPFAPGEDLPALLAALRTCQQKISDYLQQY